MTIHDCVIEAYRRLGLTEKEIAANVAAKDRQSEVAAAMVRCECIPDHIAEGYIKTLIRIYSLPEAEALKLIKQTQSRVAAFHQNN